MHRHSAPRGQPSYDRQRNQGQQYRDQQYNRERQYYDQQYDRGRQNYDQQHNRGRYSEQLRNRDYYDPRQTHPSSDSYRPRAHLPPASDFSYRSGQQLPHTRAWAPPATTQNRPIKRATGARHGNNATSARPLLQENADRDPTPEPSPTLANMTQRFKLQEGSDINDFTQARNPNSSHDASQPAVQAMGNEQGESASGNATKNSGMPSTSWSNPDPYASLPGASDQKPTKDFVRFIRNARINQETELSRLSNTSNFISLEATAVQEPERFADSKMPDPKNENGKTTQSPVPGFDSSLKDSKSDQGTVKPKTPSSQRGEKAPQQILLGESPVKTSTNNRTFVNPKTTASPGSKRGEKRARVDLDDGSSAAMPSDERAKKRPKKTCITTAVTDKWAGTSLPWVVDHRDIHDMYKRLHHEILDFYQYCRACESETDARLDLVARIDKSISKRYPGAHVLCFGSFAAGLHLPDADMDIVILSQSYQGSGITSFGTKTKMRNAARQIEIFAKQDSVELILNAKVPIIKFVDKVTGLKVDVSFDNSSGFPAVSKCLEWDQQFEAMRPLVCLVKVFLKMRGFDEVYLGGIGGYATTCMVVSLLQNMKKHKPANFLPAQSLGETLVLFFEFYGKTLNTKKLGISMEPPEYFKKAEQQRIRYKPGRPDSLSIIDPNKADNDLSNGSHNSSVVLRSFAEAHTSLMQRIENVWSDPQNYLSILECLYAGNYDHFDNQRRHLEHLSRQR